MSPDVLKHLVSFQIVSRKYFYFFMVLNQIELNHLFLQATYFLKLSFSGFFLNGTAYHESTHVVVDVNLAVRHREQEQSRIRRPVANDINFFYFVIDVPEK